MNCREAQQSILESLAASMDDADKVNIEQHVIGCEACRKFREEQLALDQQLIIALQPPSLSPHFRKSVIYGLRRDQFDVWRDSLPDVAHVSGCAAAIGILVKLLPYPAHSILTAGLGVALLTYFLQDVLRGSMEALED